jgi:hypothetical protein
MKPTGPALRLFQRPSSRPGNLFVSIADFQLKPMSGISFDILDYNVACIPCRSAQEAEVT